MRGIPLDQSLPWYGYPDRPLLVIEKEPRMGRHTVARSTVPPGLRHVASVVERLLRAYLVAFLTALVALRFGEPGHRTLAVLSAAAWAGVGPAVSLALSLVGSLTGNAATPSLLPARLDPATPPVGAVPSPKRD